MKRVYINGTGAVSAGGLGVASHYHRLSAGSSRIRYEEAADLRGALDATAEKVLLKLSNQRPYNKADRTALLAIIAAKEACDDPGVADAAIITASSRGAAGRLEEHHDSFLSDDPMPISASPTTTNSFLTAAVSQAFASRGPALFTSTACASGITAIGLGALHLKGGLADRALVVAAESCLTPFCMEMFRRAQILAKHPSVLFPMKPFHSQRNGMIPGEGAAAMYLSTDRVAETQGEVLGVGASMERATLTGVSKDGAGLCAAIHQALAQAGLGPGDVDMIVAHGAGTQKGDAAEWQAYRQVFDGGMPLVNCHKWLMGHTLGASALLSAILGLEQAGCGEEIVPPYLTDDPEVAPFFRIFPDKDSPVTLVTAMGFGGQSAAMLMRNL